MNNIHNIHNVYCQRSNVIVGAFTPYAGALNPALIGSANLANVIHPIYSWSLGKLIPSFKNLLIDAADAEFSLTDVQVKNLGLHMSAIMWSMECMWEAPCNPFSQQEGGLPSLAIIVSGGQRLLVLASWYQYATTRRMALPLYKISSKTSNLEWDNYKAWLDAAFDIKEAWSRGRERMQDDETLKLRTEALAEVSRDAVYKRIDLNKVWAWIAIQLKQSKEVPAGRIETFRSCFMNAINNPVDWTLDDLEDVQEAVLQHCDVGNEIMHFINQRIEATRSMLDEFYNSFSLVIDRSIAGMSTDISDAVPAAAQALNAEYDDRANMLSSVPAAPERQNYPSMAHFLKAQAEWRLLKSAYDARNARNSHGANNIL